MTESSTDSFSFVSSKQSTMIAPPCMHVSPLFSSGTSSSLSVASFLPLFSTLCSFSSDVLSSDGSSPVNTSDTGAVSVGSSGFSRCSAFSDSVSSSGSMTSSFLTLVSFSSPPVSFSSSSSFFISSLKLHSSTAAS